MGERGAFTFVLSLMPCVFMFIYASEYFEGRLNYWY